ncbi:hypothetical protein H4S08_004831 [Coemansia sp. RSA 1365]|nr:hypothetical protein H4S08_004831 [Coemansia sp. RSA 1365]
MRPMEQVMLDLASLPQVTDNGIKLVTKLFKFPTKTTSINLTNKLSFQMLSGFWNILVHSEVTRDGPFKIGEAHQNGRFSLAKDDHTVAIELLSGVFKAHYLIPMDKEEPLADDEYKVDFIHGHRLCRNKTPLFLELKVFGLGRVSRSRNNKTQQLHSWETKMAFVNVEHEACFCEFLDHLLHVLQVCGHRPTENDDVVNVCTCK